MYFDGFIITDSLSFDKSGAIDTPMLIKIIVILEEINASAFFGIYAKGVGP